MAANVYTPLLNPYAPNNNKDLNPAGSQYAATYNQSLANQDLITQVVKGVIYNAEPLQYLDLYLMNRKKREKVNSDEFKYLESGWGRNAMVLNSNIGAGALNTPVNYTVTAATFNAAAVDMIVIFPNNQKGNIISKTGPTTVQVQPMSGQSLPAVVIGDTLSLLSPVEADGANRITNYFRMDTITRYNFVQMVVRASRWGKMEQFKFDNAGETTYIEMNKREKMTQFRTDLSNIIWNGERGQILLANGDVAKTAGGIFPSMIAAGSASAVVTVANIPTAVEQLALFTDYKKYGSQRFIFGAPAMLLELSKAYKDAKTRYEPDSMTAKLMLDMIDIGGVKLVLVPMKIFEERSCFPADWARRIIIGDLDSLDLIECWGENMGETEAPRSNVLNNFRDFWIEATISTRLFNPLGWCYIDIL